jgi:hypothetical protein
MHDDAAMSELQRCAANYRTYATLFEDKQVRRVLTEYAALLEAKAQRSHGESRISVKGQLGA